MKNEIKKEHDHQIGLGIEYPTDPNAKKLYAVGCYTPEDWNYIHEVLTKDGTLEDNIPHECCDCADLKEHSATRAVYLLTDQEANELLNHPRVEYVHENYESYPCKYKPNPEELHAGYIKKNRYNTATKQYRNWLDNILLPVSPDSSDLNRSGYQLLRCVDKADPWYTGISTGSNQILTSVVPHYGDGTDVDVIVGDEGCWFGHVEFQTNATGTGPKDYNRKNALAVGFSTLAPSATTGTCDLLDLVLDAPYWLDPEWFESAPASRLTLRWDGTRVPVESVAREWWSNSSQRSVSFAGIGTVTITSLYTRGTCNGSPGARPLINTTHGTQCTANAVGRTQGWAYNANKWSVNVYNEDGTDFEPYFTMMKLFHQAKPINSRYGNKNPTISSNSWGYRSTSHRTNGWYFYRGQGIGTSYTTSTLPGFMKYVGQYGDGYRMKGEHSPNSALTAGKEMIDAGVIFIAAAGNSNQKQVSQTHPDFNNYWTTVGSGATLGESTHNEFGVTAYNTTNRRGYPQQLGKFIGTDGNVVYPVINIGALDDAFDSNGKERKVTYSDMGNEIDCYAPADGTLSATNQVNESRPDTYSASVTPTDSGITGIASVSTELSGTSGFRLLLNAGKRITTSSGVGTVTDLELNLIGAVGLTSTSTTPTSGTQDDGYWALTLPFTIEFVGLSTNIVYPGTNAYITFGGGSTVYSGLSFTNPALRKIMISAADNSCQRLYYGSEGIVPNRTYRIRWEGTADVSGTLGSPNMVYEATFYEANPSQIDIHFGDNDRVSYDVLTSYDEAFGGTSSACPVACGLVATKLQYNRTWTWQDVRNWLRNNVGTANTSQFFTGVESTSANDANWANVNSLEGGDPIVIWDALTGNEPEEYRISIMGNLKFSGGLSF